jgi:hypothetical protein
MPSVDSSTVESVARVFTKIKQEEVDSDHIRTVTDALDTLWDMNNGNVIDVSSNNVTKEDVETTFEFLDQFAPSKDEIRNYREKHNRNRHPKCDLNYMIEFVDNAERYINGCLPSVRDWNVEYILDGNVIEERVYDYDDEIPTEPVINGTRYSCDRTDRGDGEVTVYVSKNPIRDDVDIVINAEGDDFINLEVQDGPNIDDSEVAIDEISEEFNWGMLGKTDIVITDSPNDVITYIDNKGWEYEYE